MCVDTEKKQTSILCLFTCLSKYIDNIKNGRDDLHEEISKDEEEK